MNDNFTNIYLTNDQVGDAIKSLKKNNKFLILNGNLFTIENISSCFSVNVVEKNEKSFDTVESHIYFKFSYNDGSISKLFNVIIKLEETTLHSFLNTTTFIDKNQIGDLVKKVYSLDLNNTKKLHEYDLDLYNEALIFITSGLNIDDSKKIKDDFESKFKIYQEKQFEKNKKIIENVKELYSKLIDVKMG